MKKNYNPMKLAFNDALLVYLFGTKDREDTIERLRVVSTALADEKLRTTAFILKEHLGKVSDFVWPELYRQTMWNMERNIELDRFGWDDEDDLDDEDDFDDEDDAYES